MAVSFNTSPTVLPALICQEREGVCVCVEPYLIEVVFMTNILKEVSYPPERVLRL